MPTLRVEHVRTCREQGESMLVSVRVNQSGILAI